MAMAGAVTESGCDSSGSRISIIFLKLWPDSRHTLSGMFRNAEGAQVVQSRAIMLVDLPSRYWRQRKDTVVHPNMLS